MFFLGDHQVLHVEKRAPRIKRKNGKVEKKKSKGGKKAKGK